MEKFIKVLTSTGDKYYSGGEARKIARELASSMGLIDSGVFQ